MNPTINVSSQLPEQMFSTLDGLVISALENLSRLSTLRGCPVKPYTDESLGLLVAAEPSKKEELLRQLQNTTSILAEGTEIEKHNPSADYPERRLIEYALKFHNLKLKDDNFWAQIKNHELIEMYGMHHNQIFRTFNFFNISSYSLLELLLVEWYNLWERPSAILENMLLQSNAIYKLETTSVKPFVIPRHVIKEIYKVGESQRFFSRTSNCEFGVICPIYKEEDDTLGGFLISAAVEPIELAAEISELSFI